MYKKEVTAPAYTITAQSNNDSYGTVSLSGSVITGSPNSGYQYAEPAYTVSPANSATVSQSGNAFTVTPSANTTVTINFEAIPTHTVTYSINGNTDTTEDFAEGADITFPGDPADVNGKTFVGWVTTPIVGTTNVEPSFVTSATMSTSDITYYAVFATAEGSSETKSDVLTTSTFGSPSSYTSWSNKKATSGSNAVYAGQSTGGNSYIQLRATSPSGIVTTTTGGKAKKVSVTWNSSTASGRTLNVYGNSVAYTDASDLYSDDDQGTLLGTIVYGTSTELSITGNYAYIGLVSASNAMYLDKIVVDWETSSITYSGYATTVSSLPVPTITFKNSDDEAITSLDITAQDMEEVSVECSAGDVTLTVTSDDDAVAEYDDGYVMAYKYGTATLTATFAGNASYQGTTATLTVNVAKVATTTTVEVDIDDTDVYTATEDGLAIATVKDAAGKGITGAEVTYTSSNPAVATIAADGTITLKAAGETTITASYAGTDVYEASEGSYVLTLTSSKPQETSVTVNFNNSLYGTSFTGTNAAGSGSDKRTVSGTVENVGVTVYQGSGTNLYINNTETRIYSAGTVTLTAPTGYDITKIVFANGTAPSNWNVTASAGSLESATWTGSANSVVFTGSGRSDFTTAVVTLAPIVTVTSASYATFASPHPLDFTGKSIKAYIAKTKGDGTGVTFEQVNKVPANTGVLLYKDGGATENIPVLSGDADDVTGNVFKVGTGAAVASVDGNLHNYILNVVNDVIGFYKAAGQTVATNRAYIQIDESAGVKAFFALPGMEDTPTGIEAVESSQTTVDSKAIYNLAGQRVDNSQFTIHNSQLKRGIYIVNGRKVLVK